MLHIMFSWWALIDRARSFGEGSEINHCVHSAFSLWMDKYDVQICLWIQTLWWLEVFSPFSSKNCCPWYSKMTSKLSETLCVEWCARSRCRFKHSSFQSLSISRKKRRFEQFCNHPRAPKRTAARHAAAMSCSVSFHLHSVESVDRRSYFTPAALVTDPMHQISVSLVHHDPNDLGSEILIRIFPKERTQIWSSESFNNVDLTDSWSVFGFG